MDSPHLQHIGGSKCESDYRSISSQLVTSKDVQQLTFTYFTEKHASNGPFCPDCMNQLFRDGKLNEVYVVFVFRTLGFIPFSTRSLVFINGTNVPFSMKDISEDFLVMPCSNCARNNTKLNTIHVTDNKEVHFSRSYSTSSSGRKRRLPDSLSNEESPAEQVKQEIVSPPNLKKRKENVQIVDDQIIDASSTSVATMDEILARSGNNVVKANVTSSITNKSSVDRASVINQNEGSTIVDKSTFVTGQSVDGILGALMMRSQIDKLPTPHTVSTNNSEETAQNVNKGSTKSCGTLRKVQWSEKVDFFPVNRQTATTSVPKWLPHDTAHIPSALTTSKLLVSSTSASQHKHMEGGVPKMSTYSRLEYEGGFKQTGLNELDSFVGNKNAGQESSNSHQLAKHKLASVQQEKATNNSSPEKRNGKMKDNETTPTKMPKLEAASPCRNREISNLTLKIGNGTKIMSKRIRSGGRELFKCPEKSTSHRPRLKSSSDDSDKESRGSKQRNVRSKGKKMHEIATTSHKMEFNASADDESIEESDHSYDEDDEQPVHTHKSSPKKTRRPSLSRSVARNQRTLSKMATTVAALPTPGLANLTERMPIGTPSRSTQAQTVQAINTTEATKTTRRKLMIEVPITPSQSNSGKDFTLEGLRSVLHTWAVPEHLHCRDEEYGKIKKFVISAVGPKATSQAMYISGVPGTGKTASTKAVIQALEKKNKFTYIYINAMEFLEPKQIFVHIYGSLIGEDRVISAQNAQKKLNLIFQTYDVTRRPVLMLVDELDQLSSRRREIIYAIFDWTTLEQARVSVIAIGKTLDLPERMLSHKISSRLGTNRIIFQPYDSQQIEEIIQSRIQDFSNFVSSDAVQFAARRAVAINGDLRTALDTLRRSVEIAISKGSATLALQHVLDAHGEAKSVALVLMVCNLSIHEEVVFSAAVNQVRSKGVEEFNFAGLYREYRLLCTSREGIEPWHDIGIHSLVMKMATSRLLIAGPGKNMMLRKLRLGMLLQEADMALKERKNQEREREAEQII